MGNGRSQWNAGLFSTVEDLSVFAEMLLNKGTLKEVSIFSPGTVETMTSDHTNARFSDRRGLGWLIRGRGGQILIGRSYVAKGFRAYGGLQAHPSG